MRLWTLVLLLLVGAPLSWSVDIDEADSATVVIFVYDEKGDYLGNGSGFFVTEDGHILTNAHVVDDKRVHSIVITGKSMPDPVLARKVWVVPEYDVAVLKAEKPADLKPLRLLSESVSKGAEVWALGFPGKQKQNAEIYGELEADSYKNATLTTGIVSRIFQGHLRNFEKSKPNNGSVNKLEIIQHTAKISRGNSGGPLVDECGNVVGINTSVTYADPDEHSGEDFFAVASSGLVKLLSSRIVGLTLSDECVPEQTRTPETPASEPELEEVPDSDAEPKAQEPPQTSSSVNASIIWLILLLGLLVLGYLYVRRKNDGSTPAERVLQPQSQHRSDQPKSASPKQIFRMSGFDERGSPVSFVFEARSPYNERGQIIGRTLAFADFKITNADISRAHAQVKVTERACQIRDLGATNGTTINGVKLKPFIYTKISFGDEIGIATCTLTITT
jgi:LPXTG-motif cell wall-anchored protein